MIRALFLDAAGTLIDLVEPVGEVYTRILGQHGIETTPEAMSRAFRHAFATLPPPDFSMPEDGHEIERRWWRDLVHHALGQEIPSVAFDALFDHYADPAAWTLFPEVPDFLDRARQAGLKLAVVSNFDRRLHPILSGLGLTPAFDLIVSSADARARKPDPAIFHHTLYALDLRPEETLHIGDDARLDHAAALACGLRAFHVDRPALSLLDACW